MPHGTEIQRLNPSRRQVQTQSPTARPEDFGAGVGQALSNIAQSLSTKALLGEDTAAAREGLARAHVDRQRKIERSQTNIAFIQLRSKLQLELAEMQRNASLGGEGLADEMNELALTTFSQFGQTLPEHLQNEFNPRIAEALSGAASIAYDSQVTAENAAFILSANDLVQGWSNEIQETFSDPRATFEDIVTEMAKLYRSSPLNPALEEAQYKAQLTILEESLLVRELKDEDLDSKANGTVPGKLVKKGKRVTTTGGPVLAGLSRAADGFLTAIMGPESGGTYNALYGGDTFTDFSGHPGQFFEILSGPHKGEKTSAAGAYSIIKETWDIAVRELAAKDIIISDFSPENQDKVAWYIAQRDYYKRTGNSLSEDLKSGDRTIIARAKSSLTLTWEGLLPKKLSDSDFFNTIAAALGTPSNLMFDPIYDNIPTFRKQQLAADAKVQSNAILSQLQADVTAETNRQIEEFRKGLASGDPNYGFATAARMFEELNIPQSMRNAINGEIEKKYAAELAAGRAAIRMLNNVTDPNNADHKDDLEAYATTNIVVDTIANQDAEGAAILAEKFGKAGYIPGSLVNQLTNKINSMNSDSVFFAYNMMKDMQDFNFNAFEAAFGADFASTTANFDLLRSLYPAEEVMERLRGLISPESEEFRKVQRVVLNKYKMENPNDFTIPGVIKQLGFYKGLNGQIYDSATGFAIWNEFNASFEQNYLLLGNFREALKMSKKQLKKSWGEIVIDGRSIVMKYTPQMFNKTYQKTHDYIPIQLLAEYIVPKGSFLSLKTDGTTFEQIKGQNTPTWVVIIVDQDGGSRNALVSDTVAFIQQNRGKVSEEYANRVARWHPKITDEMVKFESDRIATLHEISRKQTEIAEAIANEVDSEKIENLKAESHALIVETEGLPAAVADLQSAPFGEVFSIGGLSDNAKIDASISQTEPPPRVDSGSFKDAPTLREAIIRLGPAGDIRPDSGSFKDSPDIGTAVIRLTQIIIDIMALPQGNTTAVIFKTAVLDRQIPWSESELIHLRDSIERSNSTVPEVQRMLSILERVQERLLSGN